jgi:hypothetical protein
MKVPGLDGAIIPQRKLRDYLLSPAHPAGRGKAAFFARLGYRQADWRTLAAALTTHAAAYDVADVEDTGFGVKYVVEGEIESPGGVPNVLRVVWIVPAVGDRLSAEQEDEDMKELDLVILAEDIPQHGLREGDVGTVVFVHEDGAAYEVEFVTLDGETVGVITLQDAQVHAVGRRQIAHARTVAG